MKSLTEVTQEQLTKNAQFAESLRELADWYESHPSLPLPYELGNSMFVFLFGKSEEEVRAILQEIGSFKKVFDSPQVGDFEAHKVVGGFTLKFHCSRNLVCTPRVVGKRTIPEQVIPATKEQVIPEREEEIIEWDCSPIMDGGAR